MRNVNLFQFVCLWLSGLVVNSVLGQATNFDIVRGDLVFFRTEVDSRPFSATQDLSRQTGSDFQQFISDHPRPHHKHYQKGNVRTNIRESDTDKNANRQGRNCPGVCRYIPDRDICPTNVIEELEADDEDYDEEYSEENSIEESESEDEEYSDEDEDDYYSDEDNEVRRTQPKMISGREKKSSPRKSQAKSLKPVYGPPGKNIHVVYPPLALTRFTATKNAKRNTTETRSQLKISMRSKSATKKRQRQRRNKVKSLESSKDVKLRAPALEQEMILRWDRVVERGPFIGGDIVLPEGVLLRPPNFRSQKKRWSDGIIPYLMDSSINSCRQNAILDAMDEIEDKTCIRFVERKSEGNYIDIRRSTVGCSSYVGMVGGAQVLNLSTGCFSKFTVTHELIHAIGFDHEQSRKDRDKYIEVDFDNVLQRKDVQFELNPSFTGDGFPYDIRSIMHYSAFLFAKDKCEPTIYPVNEKIDLCALGAGDGKGGMTNCDAAKINKMYKCGKQYSQKCKV